MEILWITAIGELASTERPTVDVEMVGGYSQKRELAREESRGGKLRL